MTLRHTAYYADRSDIGHTRLKQMGKKIQKQLLPVRSKLPTRRHCKDFWVTPERKRKKKRARVVIATVILNIDLSCSRLQSSCL